MIENTKNNISGAAIQWRTFPTPLEESCPRWQEGADTRDLHLPDGECFRWGKRILFVLWRQYSWWCKKYPSDTATKLILERTTIKSLEYLGNEVIWEYPYLADEVKQKLGGIKFVKQVDGGYGTLVGAVIVYVALLDYKYESNPKTTKELEGRIKDCITD